MSANNGAAQAAAAKQTGFAALVRRIIWSTPLGWQLSALYTLLLAITLTVIGVLVYSQQEGFLVQDTAVRLTQEANRVVSLSMQPDGDRGNLDGGKPNDYNQQDHQLGAGPGGMTAQEGQDRLFSNLVRGLSGPGVTATVLDSTGAVITTTQALEGDTSPVLDPVTTEQAASAVASGKWVQWVAARADGTRHVVVLTPIVWQPPSFVQDSSDESFTFLLQQSSSLVGADAALSSLGTYLLLGVLFGTLAGVVLGTTFTRSVLRPLDQMASTAEAIAGGDLQRRLQLPGGKNEVARLGKTFDFMVGRLVNTLEAQRRFIADASHELRTPLTSLKGMAEILMIGAHGNDGRVIEQSAGAMRGELDRMGRLVNDLLVLSRLDSTGSAAAPQTRRSRLDVCNTLSASTNQMVAVAEGRGVRLVQTCPEPLPVIGDAGQLKQVLLNLIDNALRYTPAGGEVALSGRLEGNRAKIEVRDSGSGIDERDLPHIFERFYRGDTSRTRATGNSGLGLSIVHAIVEAHGGSIVVESTRGIGTTFTIDLPLAPGTNVAALGEEQPAIVAGVR